AQGRPGDDHRIALEREDDAAFVVVVADIGLVHLARAEAGDQKPIEAALAHEPTHPRPAAVALGKRQGWRLHVRHGDGISGFMKRTVYCALMLAPRITLPHFSVSSTMIFPHCAGLSGTVSLPRSANLALMPASLRPTFTSALSFAMMSAGVPRGAPNPLRRLASEPGTHPPTAGTSGNADD